MANYRDKSPSQHHHERQNSQEQHIVFGMLHPLIYVLQVGGQLHMEISVEPTGRATADIVENFLADFPREQRVPQAFDQGLLCHAAQHSAPQLLPIGAALFGPCINQRLRHRSYADERSGFVAEKRPAHQQRECPLGRKTNHQQQENRADE